MEKMSLLAIDEEEGLPTNCPHEKGWVRKGRKKTYCGGISLWELIQLIAI